MSKQGIRQNMPIKNCKGDDLTKIFRLRYYYIIVLFDVLMFVSKGQMYPTLL